jgi:hypothetical protein
VGETVHPDSATVRNSEAKVSPKTHKKQLRIQINGKCNVISSADENK